MGGSLERYSSLAAREAPALADRAIMAAAVPLDGADTAFDADTPLDDPRLYFNRELSWLDFNWRVLAQAMDETVPLLERARYLAITQSNLDEFFAKRVGGLKRQQKAGVTQLSPDGRTPTEQLALVRDAVLRMQDAMCVTWERVVRPAMEEDAGIRILRFAELTAAQRAAVHEQFRATIYPILTPLAVDPAHPFPFISNLSHSLAVLLRHPIHGTEHFARVKIPTHKLRWLPVEPVCHYIAIEDVVRSWVGELFPGMEVLGSWLFRVTRNADLARAEEEAADLVEMIAEELRQRRFAPVVRLEIESAAPAAVCDLLSRELGITADDIYRVRGLQDLSGLASLANIDLPQFRFDGWDPVVPGPLHAPVHEAVDIFAVLRAGDLLVHHPYDSFTGSVELFIEAAAADPRVLAIKQTMYRTSEDSPIMRTLMRAAERGKQVAVLVEVTASYDEERNLGWAEQLEDSGAHVIYGVVGLKTHAKVTLVVREEADWHPDLLPHRDGQLPSCNRPALHRPGAAHGLARRRPRCRSLLSFRHRLRKRGPLRTPHCCARRNAPGVPHADPARDGDPAQWWAGSHHRQDERHRRRRTDPGPVRGVQGRRVHRPHCAWPHPASTWPAGHQREHPAPQHHRSVPGTRSRLHVRQ
jgi:polyphosphate kinase